MRRGGREEHGLFQVRPQQRSRRVPLTKARHQSGKVSKRNILMFCRPSGISEMEPTSMQLDMMHFSLFCKNCVVAANGEKDQLGSATIHPFVHFIHPLDHPR
ncbi:unnamed protein product [Victoria cruziana]